MTDVEIFRSDDVLLRKVGIFSTDVLVICFSSYTDDPRLERPGFGESFLRNNEIDAVHVISRGNAWFQYRETDEFLDRLLDVSRGYDHVFTYGSSMGAYAAIRFGSRLGAEAIAISPQYSIDPAVFPAEHRWHEARSIAFIQEDRQPISPLRKTTIFYDPRHRLDRLHVERIARDTPCVLVPVPHAGHAAGVYLADLGMLGRGIREILERRFDPEAFRDEARARRRDVAKYYESLSDAVRTTHPGWALALARKAVEAPSANAGSAHHLSEILKHNRDYEDAIIWAEKAIGIDPRNNLYRKCLALIYLEAGRSADARNIIEVLLAQNPDEADYHHLLAQSYALEMNFQQALICETRAVDLSPDHPAYRRDLRLFHKRVRKTVPDTPSLPQAAPRKQSILRSVRNGLDAVIAKRVRTR